MTDTQYGIWAGDLFGREAEAIDIIGYLESVAGRKSMREDGHAHVLAVDAPYGEGKSFFLRRFAKQMATNHPVAFVDAWTDDLEDEPLVALVATLEAALEPLMGNPTLKARFADFRAKAGTVAKIVAVGVAKRALGFAISHSAVEAAASVLSAEAEATRDIDKETFKAGPQAIVEAVATSLSGSDGSTMKERVARFNEGKAAIGDMKASLASLVESLDGGLQAPIVIIVDELDRCRPTYAIKLLEEIKHLFDVDGIVFVLGMHSNQLAHSIKAAYGSTFDSASYLKRFVSRRYTLKSVALYPLLVKINAELNLDLTRIKCPLVISGTEILAQQISPLAVIGLYMKAYGLTARNAFELMDILQTCLALTQREALHAPYLLPLIISHMGGGQKTLPDVINIPEWVYFINASTPDGDHERVSMAAMADQFHDAVSTPVNEIRRRFQEETGNYAEQAVGRIMWNNLGPSAYEQVANYTSLLTTVARFSPLAVEPDG